MPGQYFIWPTFDLLTLIAIYTKPFAGKNNISQDMWKTTRDIYYLYIKIVLQALEALKYSFQGAAYKAKYIASSISTFALTNTSSGSA